MGKIVWGNEFFLHISFFHDHDWYENEKTFSWATHKSILKLNKCLPFKLVTNLKINLNCIVHLSKFASMIWNTKYFIPFLLCSSYVRLSPTGSSIHFFAYQNDNLFRSWPENSKFAVMRWLVATKRKELKLQLSLAKILSIINFKVDQMLKICEPRSHASSWQLDKI